MEGRKERQREGEIWPWCLATAASWGWRHEGKGDTDRERERSVGGVKCLDDQIAERAIVAEMERDRGEEGWLMRWDGVMKEKRDERRELATSWAPFHQCINSLQPHPIKHTQCQYLLPERYTVAHPESVSAISEARVYTYFMPHTEHNKFLFKL